MATQIAMPQSNLLPKVKGPEMTDRDLVNDMLSFEKYLSVGYNTGLHEVQNPLLHQTIGNILNTTNDTQFQLFNLMFSHGWYKMKKADSEEINQAHKQFTNYKTQFPSF